MAVFTGGLLILIGLALGAGGAWLLWLGGSAYYLIAALGLLLTGALMVARRPGALWIYALLILGTGVWSVWEVGLDFWALVPRGAVLVALGLWLLLPFINRALSGTGGQPWTLTAGPLAVTVALAAALAALSWQRDPHDLAGALPDARAPAPPGDIEDGDWHAYGRTGLGQRYSPLDRITPDNVGGLKKLWTYHTGDVRGEGDPTETTYEVTPLKVDDTLYLCTPHHWVIALDADTGEERWKYDPEIDRDISRQHQTCRGLSYFPGHRADDGLESGGDQALAASGAGLEERPDTAEDRHCRRRLFLPTADARLIALDPDDGRVCRDFGDNGAVDLWANMPHRKDGFYYSTSPPVVTEDRVIVGGAVNDNVSTTEPSGVIRAYDVDSGELLWNWDPGDPDHTAPIAEGETYSASTPNSWSVSSVDEDLGLMYVPMGNQVPDQWGEHRDPRSARFSSSIVALELATGQVRWVFQTVHNDLWDMDVPAQPSLIDLNTDAGTVPALVAPTKQGDVYVLDRRTGEPVLPVEELPAPASLGYQPVADSQPASTLSLNPPPLRGRDMWGATLFDQLICRIQFHRLEYQGRYTPPSERGSLVYPGNFGVFNWGGLAVNPRRQVAFATPSYLAFVSTLVPRDDATTDYVSDGKPGLGENYGAPYAVTLKPFLSPLGLPCQQPPWGYVAGLDLVSGEVVWKHRNGTVRDLAPVPLPFKMGVPDLGGPILTAGGVAFMNGSMDNYVRAYDLTNGETLWQARLPAGGQATPMTYSDSQGRQRLLVVAGGHGSLGTRAGDAIIVYGLPE
ncbi:membrane-bound PQQ-dependent dehydrogenase, glucose/quinate/shikimate family [Alloalcanivorax sp. C16-1]|uniref:membrane-bound PQQ-dependent dehydrogenase, glucose/quinate/shikimate family n=1 Tax=Alloalcanivorax sp. C16-1 TaxID=3390051 RepID=UPI0039707962